MLEKLLILKSMRFVIIEEPLVVENLIRLGKNLIDPPKGQPESVQKLESDQMQQICKISNEASPVMYKQDKLKNRTNSLRLRSQY